ncbi:hypothetical protein VPNG_06804 [Cytospora leucostoma]|uniref:SMP-30/Gluconolactonase/LRE-like region domain-containing protein n=1 Tax=Cytospora leucostoma TaxID=1230097 RepID=A0A423WVV0_9PEZI|nr:hypothetical protein VPNG_06804 [Cytospora leucostoma]
MVDMTDIHIHLVTQLPQTGWFEGFTMRSNGHILVSRLDDPVLYTFDTKDKNADPQELHRFTDATSLINLCPLLGRHDEYAVISGRPDIETMQFDNRDYKVWRVALSDAGVTVTKIADLDDYGFAIGIMPAGEHALLVADSSRNRICAIDIATGVSSVLVEDASMKAAEGEAFGLNRLRIVDGFVWFTNTSAGTLSRFPISVDGARVTATGPVQLLCDDIQQCDGLAVATDGSTVWTASMARDRLLQITITEEGGEVHASTTCIKEDLYSPTAVGYMSKDGKPLLYVVCNGERAKEQAWIKKEASNPWVGFQNVTKSVEVSVVVEE